MLANLRALFGRLVDIVLLRRGPEHLPASPLLLVVVVVLNVVLYALAHRALILPLMPHPSPTWALQIVTGALITLGWYWAAFQIVRKTERFVQTMIAVFATNTLFIPAMPLVAGLIPYLQAQDTDPPPILLLLLTSIIGVWVFTVLVRIVRSAFEWSWAVSIVYVVTNNIGAAILLGLIFGDPAQAT